MMGSDTAQKVFDSLLLTHSMKEHREKNPVSARPTENGKEIKEKTELIQTMIRLDLMPIPILNKYKSEKGTHTTRSKRASA